MLNVQISWSYLSTAILQSLTITDFILVIVKPVLLHALSSQMQATKV